MGPNLAEHVPSPHRFLWFTATLAAAFAGSALVCAPVQHEPRKVQLRPGAHRCVERAAPIAVAPTPTRVHARVMPAHVAEGLEPAYGEAASATLVRLLEERTASAERPWTFHEANDPDVRLAEVAVYVSLEELRVRRGSTHCKLGVYLDDLRRTTWEEAPSPGGGGAVVRGDDPTACLEQALAGLVEQRVIPAYTDAAANRAAR